MRRIAVKRENRQAMFGRGGAHGISFPACVLVAAFLLCGCGLSRAGAPLKEADGRLVLVRDVPKATPDEAQDLIRAVATYVEREIRLRLVPTKGVFGLLILTARETGAEYVDLFGQGGVEPLLKDPGRYFAADRLHPSGDGYALWYGELARQSALREALRAN